MQSTITNRKWNVWIGINDSYREGTWVKTDGSSVSYTNWGPGRNFAMWDCFAARKILDFTKNITSLVSWTLFAAKNCHCHAFLTTENC